MPVGIIIVVSISYNILIYPNEIICKNFQQPIQVGKKLRDVPRCPRAGRASGQGGGCGMLWGPVRQRADTHAPLLCIREIALDRQAAQKLREATRRGG